MVTKNEKNSFYLEQGHEPNDDDFHNNVDDDGRPRRSGTVFTASAHIITAVIGSGVLSLAWAIAQLGWAVGPAVLVAFSLITYMTSTMLADCYRSPDPVTGKRNYTYMEVVRANLGGMKVQLCGLAQYVNLIGVSIGYTITASISMVAVKRSNCFHKYGHHVKCKTSNNPFMIIFGCIQILLSQIHNFHELSWLSMVAAIMSFAYSSIGLALSIAKVASGQHGKTTLTGVTVGVDVSATEKVWRCFQAIGDIAFAYAYSNVLIEIQDTLKSTPAENKVMKKASLVGVSTTSLFYILCGCVGYAAFGNNAPGNFLTGFGFYEPFWLIDFANVCIAIHLVGAYQVEQKEEFVYGFSELEKVYDRVSREVLWRYLEKKEVPVAYLRVIRDIYDDISTSVRTVGGDTEYFSVDVGLHKGSALSPFLFAIVTDEMMRTIQGEVSWCMLFTDDIMLSRPVNRVGRVGFGSDHVGFGLRNVQP